MRYLFFTFLTCLSISIFSQTENSFKTADSVQILNNGDEFVPSSVVEKAKELAYSGKYAESIDILDSIPNFEAQQLLARVYSWSHQYEKSLIICKQLIQDYPEVVNNYQIAATTALWGSMWSASYGYALKGIKQDGDTLTFKIIQVKALIGAKKWNEAEALCNELLSSSNERKKEIESLNEQIQKKLFRKELIVNHTQDYFTLDSSRWKNSSVILKNKTKYGPLLFTGNHSSRFNKTGIQGEIEFYPKLDTSYYAYVDLGFSNSELFPNFRNGISLFRTFKKGYELELGYRNMKFNTAGNVWFYLGSATKYIGNNSITYRFTSIHSPGGTSATHGLKLTHYLDDELSSLSLELGSGTNARDYQSYSSFKPFSNINSRRMQVDYKQYINYRIAISLSGAYEKATYRENQEGERWTFGLGLSTKF